MKPDAQAKLAAWCEQKGLKEQAIAHYSRGGPAGPEARGGVAAPGLQEAGRPLGQAGGAGRRAAGGRAAEARRPAVEAEARADPRRPRQQGRGAAGQGGGGRGPGDRPPRRADDLGRDDAGQRAVADGGACRCSARSTGRRRRTPWRRWPSSIPRPRSAPGAIETLARRDPRDVIGRLIGLVRKPFRYEVRKVGGPGSDGPAVRRGRAVQRPAVLP